MLENFVTWNWCSLGTLQNRVYLRFAHLETAYLETLQCMKNKDFYCFLLCFRFPNHKTKFTWTLVPWCWISMKTITTKEFKHCDSNSILLPKLFWPTVRKNCSRDLEKLLKFETEGRQFKNVLRSIEHFIQTVKGQNNFW